MVRHRKSPPYQFPGTKGSVSGPQEFRVTLQGSDFSGSNGQYNCGCLNKEGGTKSGFLFVPSLETSVLVPSQGNSPEG